MYLIKTLVFLKKILKDYLLNSKIQKMISYAVKSIILRINDASTVEKIMNIFIGRMNTVHPLR